MIYDVNTIANYIVNYSIDNSNPVSNLKLQKLLYYVQANFLVNKNTPCFGEDITHWRHGPVVVNVYSKFKKYFNNNILDKQELTNNQLDNNDILLIEKVINSYSNTSAWEMVAKTHSEAPWIETNNNSTININYIKNYFQNNPEKLLSD
ncbi:Panacea domain-containing protein [Sarcina ventriculi]|uniref:Panacea domain-containing protein n=1 Tax=Sarcina ventriculi TaxID=1267 RepID=UPI00073E3303|nr:type II toxin-antitoxin system antitoxin SocA domain-containing protein [Sarcina ventriculi]